MRPQPQSPGSVLRISLLAAGRDAKGPSRHVLHCRAMSRDVPLRHRKRRSSGRVAVTVLTVLVAVSFCAGVMGVQWAYSSVIGASPEPALASPDGRWEARLLYEYAFIKASTQLEIRPAGSTTWCIVGDIHDYDATIAWSSREHLLVTDGSGIYVTDVPQAYRRVAPGVLARTFGPLDAAAWHNLGPLCGLAILIVGLTCILAIPMWNDRIAARVLVDWLLGCLRGGNLWAAASLFGTDDPDRSPPAAEAERSLSELALLAYCYRWHTHVLRRVPRQADERVAYEVSAAFLGLGGGFHRSLVAARADEGWRLRFGPSSRSPAPAYTP